MYRHTSFIWTNIIFILLIALYYLLRGFDNEEVVSMLPLLVLHLLYFFVLTKFVQPSATLTKVVWAYLILLCLIVSVKALFGFFDITQMLYASIFVALLFGFYLLSQTHLLRKAETISISNPQAIQHLAKALAFIDEADIAQAFEEVGKAGVKNPILAQLKKEFMLGQQKHDFYDRLTAAIKEEKERLEQNNTKT